MAPRKGIQDNKKSFNIILCIKTQWFCEFKKSFCSNLQCKNAGLGLCLQSHLVFVQFFIFAYGTQKTFSTVNNISRVNSFQRQPIPILQTSMTANIRNIFRSSQPTTDLIALAENKCNLKCDTDVHRP